MAEFSITIFTSETVPAYAGDGRNAFLWAKVLRTYGVRAEVVALNHGTKLPVRELLEGVPLYRIPYFSANRLWRFAFRFRMLFFLLRGGATGRYWLLYGAMPAFRVIIIVGRLLGRRVIYRSTRSDFDCPDALFANRSFPVALVNRLIMNGVAAFFALNSCFARQWKNRMGWRIPIFVSAQGVNLDRFSIPFPSKKDIRSELGLPSHMVIVLMVGHLVERKGFPVIFDWLSRLHADFLLLHVGNTSAAEWDRMSLSNDLMERNRLAGTRLLGKRVCFWGPEPRVERLFLASDVFLLASEAEGYPPNSVNEAMAAALPVVSNAIEGADEYIGHGTNGYLYSDFSEFEFCMNRLLTDSSLRKEMGECARKLAEQRADVNQIVQRFIRFLSNLA